MWCSCHNAPSLRSSSSTRSLSLSLSLPALSSHRSPPNVVIVQIIIRVIIMSLSETRERDTNSVRGLFVCGNDVSILIPTRKRGSVSERGKLFDQHREGKGMHVVEKQDLHERLEQTSSSKPSPFPFFLCVPHEGCECRAAVAYLSFSESVQNSSLSSRSSVSHR